MTPAIDTPASAPDAPRHRRALMLINRRGTRSHANLEACLNILEASGIEVSAHFVRDPDRIPDLIGRHAAEADLVVIGGGDGTVSSAADALVRAGRPLGILPMGNANDLARTLGIPVDAAAAAAVIARGRTRRIDLGWVNGRHFFNVASLGLSVRIARRLDAETKRRWGVLGYVRCAWDALHPGQSFVVDLDCDGSTHRCRALQVAVGNGRYYGGGMTIVADAAIDDGRLDVYALRPFRWWRLLVLLPALRWGWHRSIDDVLSLHGTAVTVDTDRPMAINVDGEVIARTPAEFRVVPGALSVFAA
jgi:YegS/Rv2252/BmrU family lipid kinase